MNRKELKLLDKWLSDNSFINWVNNRNDRDISKWDDFFRTNLELLEVGGIGKQMLRGVPFVPININNQKKKESLMRFQKKLALLEKDDQPNYRLSKILKIAISSAAIILLCLSLYTHTEHYNQTHFSTQYGEMASYILPDNSTVTLNANSNLMYDKRHPREVWIHGEAFFEIVKKTKTAINFKVHSDDATITVLGTSFNVNSRNNETRVYLKEGKIKLKFNDINDDKVLEMHPGETITYSKENKEIINKENAKSSSQAVSWLDGSLVFKNEVLSTILEKMEEIYGVSFVVKSKNLVAKKITIGIPINNLNIALEAIQTSLNASIIRNNNIIKITEKQELRLPN